MYVRLIFKDQHILYLRHTPTKKLLCSWSSNKERVLSCRLRSDCFIFYSRRWQRSLHLRMRAWLARQVVSFSSGSLLSTSISSTSLRMWFIELIFSRSASSSTSLSCRVSFSFCRMQLCNQANSSSLVFWHLRSSSLAVARYSRSRLWLRMSLRNWMLFLSLNCLRVMASWFWQVWSCPNFLTSNLKKVSSILLAISQEQSKMLVCSSISSFQRSPYSSTFTFSLNSSMASIKACVSFYLFCCLTFLNILRSLCVSSILHNLSKPLILFLTRLSAIIDKCWQAGNSFLICCSSLRISCLLVCLARISRLRLASCLSFYSRLFIISWAFWIFSCFRRSSSSSSRQRGWTNSTTCSLTPSSDRGSAIIYSWWGVESLRTMTSSRHEESSYEWARGMEIERELGDYDMDIIVNQGGNY